MGSKNTLVLIVENKKMKVKQPDQEETGEIESKYTIKNVQLKLYV